MGLRRLARVGGGRDVVPLTPTQTVPPAPIPVPPRGMGPGTSVGRALGAAGPYWEDWGGGRRGAPVWPCHPVGSLHGWAMLPCGGGSGGPPVPEDTVGASCPPAAAGGRHVATGTFLLPHGCRLSLLFVPPPQDPHAYSPPPQAHRRSSCCEFLPSPTSGQHLGGGRLPPAMGAFGGQDAAGGGPWGPESARGERDERGRCLGDSARAGRAAKGCRLMRRQHGGGRGERVPPRLCPP